MHAVAWKTRGRDASPGAACRARGPGASQMITPPASSCQRHSWSAKRQIAAARAASAFAAAGGRSPRNGDSSGRGGVATRSA
eukprot:7390390-Lingulodinium_polyedra.AAC.1